MWYLSCACISKQVGVREYCAELSYYIPLYLFPRNVFDILSMLLTIECIKLHVMSALACLDWMHSTCLHRTWTDLRNLHQTMCFVGGQWHPVFSKAWHYSALWTFTAVFAPPYFPSHINLLSQIVYSPTDCRLFKVNLLFFNPPNSFV